MTTLPTLSTADAPAPVAGPAAPHALTYAARYGQLLVLLQTWTPDPLAVVAALRESAATATDPDTRERSLLVAQDLERSAGDAWFYGISLRLHRERQLASTDAAA